MAGLSHTGDKESFAFEDTCLKISDCLELWATNHPHLVRESLLFEGIMLRPNNPGRIS